MKKLLAAAIAVTVLLAGLYVGSPFLGFYRLQQAARSGDVDALEAAVDFPAVRESFKAEVKAALLHKLDTSPKLKGNALAALGLVFADALVDKVVDGYLTPDAISLMVTQARAPQSGHPPQDKAPPALDRHFAWISMDRVRVMLARHDRPDLPLGFVMEHRGLFGWKLVRIDLPDKLFG